LSRQNEHAGSAKIVLSMVSAKWKNGSFRDGIQYAGLRRFQSPHGVVPSRFDVEMKWRNVIEEARVHEIVGISARLNAMRGCTVTIACDSSHSLQKG
jgi:hypothetical protein